MAQVLQPSELSFRSDIWDRFPIESDYSFSEVLGAAFRTENTFAAGFNFIFEKYNSRGIQDVVGYDALEQPWIPTQFLEDVMYSRSPRETQIILESAQKRIKDREILSSVPMSSSFGAVAIASIADPLALLFGSATAIKAASRISTFAQGAKSGLKAGLLSGAATEGTLAAIQPERSKTEVVAGIFASGVFGAGLVGGIAVGRHNAASVKANKLIKLGEDINKDLSEGPIVFKGTEADFSRMGLGGSREMPGSKRNAPGVGNQPLGRPQARRSRSPKTGDVPTWAPLDSAQQMMFPGARTRASPFKSVSETSERLVESNTLKEKNMAGVASEASVETLAKQHMGALVQLLSSISSAHKAYRLRTTGKSEGVFVSAVRDKFSDLVGVNRSAMSIAEFRRMSTGSLRSGKASGIKEVDDSVKSVREMFDYYGKDAVNLGLIKPEQVVSNYVPRVWNVSEVYKRRSDLVMLIIRDQSSRGLTPDVKKINAQVDRILDNGTPIEGMDGLAGPRGVFQKRDLDINEELFDDFLVNDIDDILRSYVRIVSTDTELARKFGRVDMRDQVEEIRNEAKALILGIQDNKKIPLSVRNERIQKIEERLNSDVKAIEGLRDILRGIYGLPENPYGISSRAARLIMDFNNIIMLGGATFASLSDAARIVMQVGLQDSFKMAKFAVSDLQMAKAAGNEVKLAGTALDMALQTTAMRLTGMQDMAPRFSKAEAAMGYLTNGFFIANLLSPWNAMIKQAAGIAVSHKMLGDAISWSSGTLSKAGQARMLSAGFNIDDAKKIAQIFKVHGETINDVRLPNTQLWDDLPGFKPGDAKKLQTKYRAALARDVDATVVTPGAGDQPLWVHNTFGRLIAQYKSFGFAAANKVLVPGLQYKDAAQLHGAMMAVFTGGMISVARDRMNNMSQEKSLAGFVADGIDQSGLLGWYFQANNMVEAISDGNIGLRPMIGERQNFSRRYAAGQISPSLTTISRASSIFGDVVTGNVDHNTRLTTQRMIPGNTLFYLKLGDIMRTSDNLEKVNRTGQ